MPTPRARTRRAAVGLTATGTITSLYTLQPVAGLIVTAAAAATIVVLTCALLLPATWSKRASRRTAALTVVRVLLNRELVDPTKSRSTTSSARSARKETFRQLGADDHAGRNWGHNLED